MSFNQDLMLFLYHFFCQHVSCGRGRVVQSVLVVINIITVQKLLVLFCCVLGKALYSLFLCLAVLASNSKFCNITNKKTKNKVKISTGQQYFFLSLEADWGNSLQGTLCIAPTTPSCRSGE